jgi:hypothetical protein
VSAYRSVRDATASSGAKMKRRANAPACRKVIIARELSEEELTVRELESGARQEGASA